MLLGFSVLDYVTKSNKNRRRVEEVIIFSVVIWGDSVKYMGWNRDYHSVKNKREHTHSVTVFEDFSRLKASWYLRLSTSFFIWGKSISSMTAA